MQASIESRLPVVRSLLMVRVSLLVAMFVACETVALAQELPRGLAAVPLNPGIIDTDMLRSCFGADAAG